MINARAETIAENLLSNAICAQTLLIRRMVFMSGRMSVVQNPYYFT